MTARRAALTPSAPTAEETVVKALSSLGFSCDALDVQWLDQRGSALGSLLGNTRAIVRARSEGEPADLYLVDARLSPQRTVMQLGDVHDITDTSGVDESRPILHGHIAVYTTEADGAVTALHVIDLAGFTSTSNSDLNRIQRAQIALSNWQQTGQARGLAHTAFAFDPIARRVNLVWRADGALEVVADGHLIEIDPIAGKVLSGAALVRVVTDVQARPGNLLTWAVDRARAAPWFGDERMQWLKAVVFFGLDKVRALWPRRITTADDVRSELGVSLSSVLNRSATTDAESGWPPTPMRTLVTPALPGEGQWITLENDPFITHADAGGRALATSYVRPNAHRLDERVYVTLWDPRQIAMHIEAGTVEPISATGEHGPGMIPRAPEVLTHLVAAFNGGFQAQHGEYGMVAHGIEYLGPKPYAATVMELRDGSNAFGAWPNSVAVPDDVVALRQNLTALVQNGTFNPWGRTWWGGAPPDWPDQIHSTRSAVCLTKDEFVGYFYSPSISAEDLAAGMLAARCSFGIHLDMNPGHAGFEFYDVAPAGQLPPLGRRLQPDWEAEGTVSGLTDYAFRSRRMIRAMGHMLFPRYIQREARDFFYLTARPLLPGAALESAVSPPESGEGVWQTKGLAQGGFPPAIATAWVRAMTDHGVVRLRVVRADPRMLAPPDLPQTAAKSTASSPAAAKSAASSQAAAKPSASSPAAAKPSASSPAAAKPPASWEQAPPIVLSWNAPASGALVLWWSPGFFAIAPSPPVEDAVALLGGESSKTAPPQARAAVGVQDEDGMLAWIEMEPGFLPDSSTAQILDSLLQRLGCSTRMVVGGSARILLGGSSDAAGNPLPEPPAPAIARLVRTEAPGAHAALQDTPIVPIQVWQPIQAKRVRYFLKVPK